MTYMRGWKSHRLTSHTWLGLTPQIGRPFSRIVGAIGFFFTKNCIMFLHSVAVLYVVPKICLSTLQDTGIGLYVTCQNLEIL
jgi:hypothetical protein